MMEVRLLKCPEDNEIIKKICNNLDYAELRTPVFNDALVAQVCRDARTYQFNAVVAHPYTMEAVVRGLEGSPVKTLMGFGFDGWGDTQSRLVSAKKGLDAGIGEIDMVLHVPFLKMKKYDIIKADFEKMVNLAAPYKVGVKMLLEVGFLNDEEKCIATDIGIEAGCEFIKLTTGQPGSGKGTIHDILLLKKHINGRCKLKASGSIQYLEDAWALMEAGADRTSSRHTIVDQMVAMGYAPENA